MRKQKSIAIIWAPVWLAVMAVKAIKRPFERKRKPPPEAKP